MQNSALSPPKSSTLSRIVAMGQFVTPQNSAAMPMGRAERGTQTDKQRQRTAERGTDEQRGHDLAALKACTDRDGGKDHLEQECLGTHDALFKNALDDVHTAAVIRARTDQAM